jgi:hypothetical protein
VGELRVSTRREEPIVRGLALARRVNLDTTAESAELSMRMAAADVRACDECAGPYTVGQYFHSERLLVRDLVDNKRATLAQLSVSNRAPPGSTLLAPDVGLDS